VSAVLDEIRISSVARNFSKWTTRYYSGFEAHGTLHGDANIAADGRLNGSLVLDGDGDYVEIKDQPQLKLGSQDFSMRAFVKLDNLTGYQTIFSKWGAVAYYSYWLYSGPNGDIYFNYSANGGNVYTLSATGVLNMGAWQRVDVKRTGDTLSLLIDRAKQTSQSP